MRQFETVIAGDTELKPDIAWQTAYIGGSAPRFFLAFNPASPNDALATMVLSATDLVARERLRSKLQARAAAEIVPQARLQVSRLELGPMAIAMRRPGGGDRADPAVPAGALSLGGGAAPALAG